MSILDNFFNDTIEKTVFISEEQLADVNATKLIGKYFEETCIFNIFPAALVERGEYLGEVYQEGNMPEGITGLCAQVEGDKLAFYYDGKRIKAESYGLYQSIFSRNKGILETDKMTQKRVVVLGCGSVGSLVSMELARAGVSHFLLCDADIVEYHNVCRHQCGIEDVGDLKINALERRLKNINPKVQIVSFEGIVQNIPKKMLEKIPPKLSNIFVML